MHMSNQMIWHQINKLFANRILWDLRLRWVLDGFPILQHPLHSMGLLSDTKYCGLRMRRECLERFSRHLIQRKPLVSDPGMHHGTCVTHVPWCISGSQTRGGGENVPGIPDACATHNFTYLARGPYRNCHGLCQYHCVVPFADVTFQLQLFF